MRIKIVLPTRLKETRSFKTKDIEVYNADTGFLLDNVTSLRYTIDIPNGIVGVIEFVNKRTGDRWMEPIDYVLYAYKSDMEIKDSFFL